MQDTGRIGEVEGARGMQKGRFVRRLLEARVLGRYRPLVVNIEPTHRCNLSCSFCDKGRQIGPQMETDRALRLVDELADAGTCSVCFDGGEPLLHPDIGMLIERARRRNLRVAISTNGILIPKRLDALARVHVIKISLDGNEQQHDLNRGPGAYRRALAGARAAREHGMDVTLRMTMGERNLDGWPAVLQTAKQLGCTALFQPATGSIMDESVPPGVHSPLPHRFRETIDRIATAQVDGAPVANEAICLRHLRSWPEPRRVPFCAGGRIQVAISPTGDMFPCGRYGRHLPAPNAFTSGVLPAFRAMVRPRNCANCWCTLTLGTCFLWRLDPRLLSGHFGVPRSFTKVLQRRSMPDCVESPSSTMR